MNASAKNPEFLAALREVRRRAGTYLAANVGLAVRRSWLRDIGPVTLLTVEVLEPLRAYLGGRLPLTMCHAVATQLEPGLVGHHPMIRISDEPRRRPTRVRRTP